MATVYAISNQKGGVGKTTTTGNLAAGLHGKGFRVLVVDMDPQGNLGFSMGADVTDRPTLYEILKGEVKIQYALQKLPQADFIASSILLSTIEMEFTDTGREFLLKDALEPLQERYDYILLDTPPALGILTINAFTAAHAIIVPMLSDIFSLQGISQLTETVERVRRYCNPDLFIKGILLTKHNPRSILCREVRGTAELIGQDLHIPVFQSFIRSSISVSEAQSFQKSIMEYAPESSVAKDYEAFVQELVQQGV